MFMSSLTWSALLLASISILCVTKTVVSTSTTTEEPLVVSSILTPLVKIRNFIATDTLNDGEHETRIHYNGITAKETAVTTKLTDTGDRQGVKLRQVTDGTHFIQLIYSADDELRDCEYIRQKKIVSDFLDTFRDDVERAKESNIPHTTDSSVSELEEVNDKGELVEQFRNVTFQILDYSSTLPSDIARWLDYGVLKQQCKSKHKELKRILRHKEHGNAEEKRHALEHIERFKRALTDMFIAPGTKWCGPHQLAKRYSELGPVSVLDRCCRRHDHCRLAIPGFTAKYNLLNYRPFTLSHCSCDASFRTCLKMTGTGAANLVGKLFFNIVQTKCFVLKPQKTCKKASWWGKCEKYGYQKQAHLRNNVPY